MHRDGMGSKPTAYLNLEISCKRSNVQVASEVSTAVLLIVHSPRVTVARRFPDVSKVTQCLHLQS
jgi:hypothetical protein